jgi:hypothetical protein
VNGATCTQNAGESIYKAYLRCGIAKSAAENADIVEVQSQTLQGDPDRYVAFTKRAAAQVRETNPAVHVVSGFRVRSQESLDEVKRTWAASVGIVDGHYLAMSPADAAGLLQFIGQCDAQSPAPA